MRQRLAFVVLIGAAPFAAVASCFPEYGFLAASDGGGADGPADTVTDTPGKDGGVDAQEDSTDAAPEAQPFDASGTVVIEAGTRTIAVVDQSQSVFFTSVTLTYSFAIDAYEVTVGRFAGWVANQQPVPCDGGDCDLDPAHYPGQMVWSHDWNAYVGQTGYSGGASCIFEADGAATFTLDGGATYPITCANWAQAEAFCVSENKRLPTETEWMIAALGADDTPYPWGDSGDDAGCGFATLQGCAWPTPVGSAPMGKTPTGISDLLGSVSEWYWDYVAATYGYPPEAGANYAGQPHPYDGGAAAFFGLGNYYTESSFGNVLLDLAHTVTRSGDPTQGLDTLGFRCVHAF